LKAPTVSFRKKSNAVLAGRVFLSKKTKKAAKITKGDIIQQHIDTQSV